MPVHECRENNKPGFQWGDEKCYTYDEGDDKGKKEAKRKAFVQGYTIKKNEKHE